MSRSCDIKNFESDHYVVSQDKIHYIEEDTIAYDVVHG